MNPNKKIEKFFWYTKNNPPLWILADFEFRNIPINDPQKQKLANRQTSRNRLKHNEEIHIMKTWSSENMYIKFILEKIVSEGW